MEFIYKDFLVLIWSFFEFNRLTAIFTSFLLVWDVYISLGNLHIQIKIYINMQSPRTDHRFGLYDEASKCFFLIPVKTEEEFKEFVERMGIQAGNHQQNHMAA